MKNIRTYTGHIETLTRLASSENANPRFSVIFRKDGGGTMEFRTPVDSSLGYSIQNYHHTMHVQIEVGTHYEKNTLKSIKIYGH